MITQQYLEKNLLKILENARLAPSVHNSQPWKVSIKNNAIEVGLDDEHVLKDGDPTGRETILSLGIFAESILISAENVGLYDSKVSYKDKKAFVEFSKEASTPKNESKKLIHALKKRATDRSVYKKINISSQAKNTILNAWKDPDLKIWLIDEENKIDEIANLTSNGIGLALTNPAFRKELSEYIIEPWSSKKRGISVNSLYIPKLIAVIQPLFVRFGIGLTKEVKLEHKRWKSSSAVVLITSVGDMPEYWFSAGRAYLRVSLAIEQLGFSQATSAATVEASNYHEDVEKLLNTKQRLQCVLRIGEGSNNRAYSPRVEAKSLVIS
jgi:hypothetical protein